MLLAERGGYARDRLLAGDLFAHNRDLGSDAEGLMGQRWLIDIAREEGVVCQNGTLERPLQGIVTPPFPLRIPTMPPPCPLPTQNVTSSVPFWHCSGTVRDVQGTRRQVRIAALLTNRFRLTFRQWISSQIPAAQ